MTTDKYSCEQDLFYCYPGSDVLKNKLGITDAGQLKAAEREITALRAMQLSADFFPEGKFDAEHLKGLHRALFQDIYDWAGEFRKVNIAKGTAFCRYPFISEQLDSVFHRLKEENYLRDCGSKRELAGRLAYYLGEINAIHPFREGNGRCQRLFIEQLAGRAGYRLDFKEISPAEMLEASVRSFYGDCGLLAELLERGLSGSEAS